VKTKTKFQILEIINKKESVRPVELVNLLKISPQAVHRHLKALVSEGAIEPRGQPPFTQYTLIDRPDFRQALRWFQSNEVKNTVVENNVSETRDIFTARLNHFIPLVKQGFSQEDLPLIISTCGEIGNNSFDHNLGQWRDFPGCWFEIQMTRNRLWVLIADRGQGIYSSLSKAFPSITSEQVAIEKAFEEHLSGRAPEKRGNGLKYVKNIITASQNRGLSCRSGSGQVDYGRFGKDCLKILNSVPSNQKFGAITLISWGLK